MALNPNPPERRSPEENHATLLVSWWCTLCALVIILFRVVGRLNRAGTLLSEDKYMCWAIIPLLIRMGLVHVVLLYGTNNTTLDGLTPEGAYHRTIGARCVLAARIFYAMFIWISKLTVTEFLKRLTTSTWNRKFEYVLNGIRGFLVVTFIAVVIGTLAECQPFSHYWQVIPDPGPSCRSGYVQLFVMGISDIITDIVLIIFPLPVIFSSNMNIRRKISTSLLYSLSAFLIAIATYRIVAIVDVQGRQQRRSLWASLEILASAAATNAVIIGSYVRDKGVKKKRYRSDRSYGIQTGDAPSFNRQLTRQHWGTDSDEDLFRSVVRGRMGSLATQGGARARSPTVGSFAMSPFSHTFQPKDAQPYTDATAEDDAANANANANASARIPSHSDRHPSETLDVVDAGGLLGGRAAPPSPSSAVNGASAGRSLAATHSTEAQAVAGASPEIRAERRAGSTSGRGGGVAMMGPRQVLPPNGRPRGPGDELELYDPGGLLG